MPRRRPRSEPNGWGRVAAPVLVTLATAIALVVAACSSTGGTSAPGVGRVVRVVDGDTVVVELGGQEETVRLIGIDTPETVDPRRPVGCFGTEASDRTKALLSRDTEVRLVRDVEERDRYGRLLAYVYRAEDGRFVNLELIAGGYANLLTIPPNVAFTDAFAEAERAARRESRGLWSACPAPG